MSQKAEVARRVTGLPAASHRVPVDASTDGVRCGRCARRLEAGQRIVVLLREHEGKTWEPIAYRCPDHETGGLLDVTAVHGDSQALVRATLEPTGTHDPIGGFDPEALTLGDVVVERVHPAGGA